MRRSGKSDEFDILLDARPSKRRPGPRPHRPGRGSPASRLGGFVVRLALSAIPVVTLGVFAWVPFTYRAVRRRTLTAWAVVGTYLTGGVLGLVLAVRGNPPSGATDNGLSTAGGFILLGLMFIGAIHSWIALSPAALGTSPSLDPAALPDADPNTWVLERAAMERRHRAEARAILARDPAMARDLMIGRPDLARPYNDGGLVDVNHVPAQVLCAKLGWSPAEAAAVVEFRASVGLFTNADELVVYASLAPERVDPVADLLVFRAV